MVRQVLLFLRPRELIVALSSLIFSNFNLLLQNCYGMEPNLAEMIFIQRIFRFIKFILHGEGLRETIR
jgi:hypothetical protein